MQPQTFLFPQCVANMNAALQVFLQVIPPDQAYLDKITAMTMADERHNNVIQADVIDQKPDQTGIVTEHNNGNVHHRQHSSRSRNTVAPSDGPT